MYYLIYWRYFEYYIGPSCWVGAFRKKGTEQICVWGVGASRKRGGINSPLWKVFSGTVRGWDTIKTKPCHYSAPSLSLFCFSPSLHFPAEPSLARFTGCWVFSRKKPHSVFSDPTFYGESPFHIMNQQRRDTSLPPSFAPLPIKRHYLRHYLPLYWQTLEWITSNGMKRDSLILNLSMKLFQLNTQMANNCLIFRGWRSFDIQILFGPVLKWAYQKL